MARIASIATLLLVAVFRLRCFALTMSFHILKLLLVYFPIRFSHFFKAQQMTILRSVNRVQSYSIHPLDCLGNLTKKK